MSGARSFRSAMRAVQWQWTRHGESTLFSAERSLGRALDDGAWLQHTEPSPAAPFLTPAALETRIPLWRRFLIRRGAQELHLSHTQRAIRLWGSAARHVASPPEWRAYVAFSSRCLGAVTQHVHFRGGCFPDRALMRRFAALMELPPLQPAAASGETLWLDGDFLVRALANAIERAVDLARARGEWRAQGPVLRTGASQGQDEEGDAEGWSNDHPLSVDYRFVPRQFAPPPENAWRALHYDADRHAIYCVSGGPWRSRNLAVKLGRPLYRFVPALDFCGPTGAHIVNGVQYRMPAAILRL